MEIIQKILSAIIKIIKGGTASQAGIVRIDESTSFVCSAILVPVYIFYFFFFLQNPPHWNRKKILNKNNKSRGKLNVFDKFLVF